MKKVVLSAIMLMGLAFSAQAQDISKHALGLRIGDNDGLGAEISYQHGLSGNNRVEADLGLRSNNHYSAFKLSGIYQWVWNIDGGFNWYAGVGGGIGSWSYSYNGNKSSGAVFNVAGDIGIEYNFSEAPIQLSLDLRPELYLNNNDYRSNNFGPDIALGVRYRFN